MNNNVRLESEMSNTAITIPINQLPEHELNFDERDFSVTLPLARSPRYINVVYPRFDSATGDLRVRATIEDGHFQEWTNTGTITDAWVLSGYETVNIVVEHLQNGTWSEQPLIIRTRPRPSPDPTVTLIPPQQYCRVFVYPALASQIRLENQEVA